MLTSITRFIGITCFLFLAANFLYVRKVTEDIKSGKNIPKVLVEFPIHETSTQDYLATKKKIEDFFLATLNNQVTNLTLNADDLNNIYTKGINLNKYIPGKFLYYEIKDNTIVESKLEWPSPDFLTVCYTEKRTITFHLKDNIVLETSKLIEVDNRQIKDETITAPLVYSKIISYIFGGIKSPSDAPEFSSDAAEYQRTLRLMGKIKSIEIEDNLLIIKT